MCGVDHDRGTLPDFGGELRFGVEAHHVVRGTLDRDVNPFGAALLTGLLLTLVTVIVVLLLLARFLALLASFRFATEAVPAALVRLAEGSGEHVHGAPERLADGVSARCFLLEDLTSEFNAKAVDDFNQLLALLGRPEVGMKPVSRR